MGNFFENSVANKFAPHFPILKGNSALCKNMRPTKGIPVSHASSKISSWWTQFKRDELNVSLRVNTTEVNENKNSSPSPSLSQEQDGALSFPADC